MKTLIIAMGVMLFAVASKAQLSINVTNFTNCNVLVNILTSDVNCMQVTNWGSLLMAPGDNWTIADANVNAAECEMSVTVGPGGANVQIAPLGASGICWPTSGFDPAACAAVR
jgi:hypothetical protein